MRDTREKKFLIFFLWKKTGTMSGPSSTKVHLKNFGRLLFFLYTTRCIVCFVPLQEKLFRKASEKQTHFCSANCMIKETDEFLLDSYCQMIHQGRSRGQKCYWWGLPLQGQPLTFYLHITGMSCGMRVAHTTNIWYDSTFSYYLSILNTFWLPCIDVFIYLVLLP